jgi:mRNA interferase MazF
VILTRDSSHRRAELGHRAPITSTTRSIPTEVVLTKDDELPSTCAANFDNLQTVPKNNIGDRIARLAARKMKETGAAVLFALGFDDE